VSRDKTIYQIRLKLNSPGEVIDDLAHCRRPILRGPWGGVGEMPE